MFHLEKVQWYLKYKIKFSINRKVGWKFEHILLFQEDVIRMRNAKLYEYLVKYDNYWSNIPFFVCFFFINCFFFVLFCWFSFSFVAELYLT